MNIITSTRLAKVVYSAKSVLENVGKFILPEHREKFSEAVNRYDANQINDIINESLKKYFGDNNIIYAIEKYCNKFGIEKKFFAMTDTEIISFVAGQYDTISKKLDAAGFPKGGN